MKFQRVSTDLIWAAIALGMLTFAGVAQEAPRRISATPGKILTIQLPAREDVEPGEASVFKIPEDQQPGEYFLVLDRQSRQLSLVSAVGEGQQAVAVIEVLPDVSAEFLICRKEHRDSNGAIDQAERLGASCTFSLLGFEEAKDAFGKRVAKTYLAVQVTVRNLSREYEYLLHDIGLGWNHLSLSSRAHGVVRGVLEKGRVKTPRNQFVRFLEFSGEVLGGITVFPTFTSSFSKGVGLFQGALTEGFKGFWPDFTIEQLNRLNDLGFDTHKRVVPRADSLFAIAFIPQQVLITPYDSKRFRKTEGFSARVLGTVSRFSCNPPEGGDFGEHQLDLYENHFPFFLQCLLQVRLAGAHVQEVQDLDAQSQSDLRTAEPSDLPQGFSGNVIFRGSDLTRVEEIAAFSTSGDRKLGIAVSGLTYDSSGLSLTASVVVPDNFEMQEGLWKARVNDAEEFALEGPRLEVSQWRPTDYTIEPPSLPVGNHRVLVIYSPKVARVNDIVLFQEGTTTVLPTRIHSQGPERIRLEVDVPAGTTGPLRLRFTGPNGQVHESETNIPVRN